MEKERSIKDLHEENKALLKVQREQSKELQRLAQEDDIPKEIKRYTEEIRTLKEQVRKYKDRHAKDDATMKNQHKKLLEVTDRCKVLVEKLKAKNIDPNGKLDAEQLKVEMERREKTIQTLERQVGILQKAKETDARKHRQMLSETNKKASQLQATMDALRTQLDEKEKELRRNAAELKKRGADGPAPVAGATSPAPTGLPRGGAPKAKAKAAPASTGPGSKLPVRAAAGKKAAAAEEKPAAAEEKPVAAKKAAAKKVEKKEEAKKEKEDVESEEETIPEMSDSDGDVDIDISEDEAEEKPAKSGVAAKSPGNVTIPPPKKTQPFVASPKAPLNMAGSPKTKAEADARARENDSSSGSRSPAPASAAEPAPAPVPAPAPAPEAEPAPSVTKAAPFGRRNKAKRDWTKPAGQ